MRRWWFGGLVAVVLEDPGPWMCAGQTGGRVYVRVNDDWNLDRAALERRRGGGSSCGFNRHDLGDSHRVQAAVGGD